MAVKYALLGLLVEQRGYGYSLMQRLKERLGPAWQLNPSTVYAALDQLEIEELIVGRSPASEESARAQRRVRRIVYEATERGESAFEAWVRQPSCQQEPIRSELQLKVATARPEDVAGLVEAMDHASRLAHMLLDECRDSESDGQRRSSGPATLALAAAIYHLEGELRWLEMARAALRERPSRPQGREGLSLRRSTIA